MYNCQVDVYVKNATSPSTFLLLCVSSGAIIIPIQIGGHSELLKADKKHDSARQNKSPSRQMSPIYQEICARANSVTPPSHFTTSQ